ncbi:peptidoglycan-binding domain-containing protein, partial [Devosia sp.]|uniref:peptidoglycan-binding domain-containing protein n=1 Tax=Devosia sp. TaxID=1871048 RepID=UPI002F1A7072
MTAATLTHLPLAAGGAVLSSAGRAALWVLSRYMRAPLTNSAILSMVTLTAMAGSNALYLQEHKHPAPLFAPPAAQQPAQAVRITPVVPAERPNRPAPPALEPVTGSIGVETGPIGNSDVFEMQRKLQLLGLFDGTIDGYYGPQTARAIKKFEEVNGLPPRGELTQEILTVIRNAPGTAVTPAPRQLAAPEPLAGDPLPRVEVQPVSEAPTAPETLPAVMPRTVTQVQPLPPPKPLVVGTAPQAQPAAQAVAAPTRTALGRKLPETPQQAFNIAVDTAGDAIDTIIAGVQGVASQATGA